MPGRHPHSCVNDQFRPADEAVQRQRSHCKGEVLQCKHCGWVVIRNATMMRNHVLEGCDEIDAFIRDRAKRELCAKKKEDANDDSTPDGAYLDETIISIIGMVCVWGAWGLSPSLIGNFAAHVVGHGVQMLMGT